MQTYKSYLPENARVIIDYNLKEKVKFSYPIKPTFKEAVWKNVFTLFTLIWILFNTLILLIYYIVFILISLIDSPTIITKIEPTDILLFLLIIIGGIIYTFALPLLITFILSKDKKLLSEIFPKINLYFSLFTGSSIKTKKILPKDIKNNRTIIPNFNNVYLHYKCFGDFHNCLQRIEILELPFNYKNYFFFKKRAKVVKNNFIYYAIFKFNKIPKNGHIDVEFS